jgi:hypothetical protein
MIGESIAFDLPAIASPDSQAEPRLIASSPVADFLAHGLVVIQYRAENLRIAPVFGPFALHVTPGIGHLHITVDEATWQWADASGEPLVVQGLEAGQHAVRLDLADPAHRVIDSQTVTFETPPRGAAL